MELVQNDLQVPTASLEAKVFTLKLTMPAQVIHRYESCVVEQHRC